MSRLELIFIGCVLLMGFPLPLWSDPKAPSEKGGGEFSFTLKLDHFQPMPRVSVATPATALAVPEILPHRFGASHARNAPSPITRRSAVGMTRVMVEPDPTEASPYHIGLFLNRANSEEFSGLEFEAPVATDLSINAGLLDDARETNPRSRAPRFRLGLSKMFGAAELSGGVDFNLARRGSDISVGGDPNMTFRKNRVVSHYTLLPNPNGSSADLRSGIQRLREGLPEDLFISFSYKFTDRVQGAITLGNIDTENHLPSERDYLGVQGAYKFNQDIKIKAGVKEDISTLNDQKDRNVWTEVDLKF